MTFYERFYTSMGEQEKSMEKENFIDLDFIDLNLDINLDIIDLDINLDFKELDLDFNLDFIDLDYNLDFIEDTEEEKQEEAMYRTF